MNKYSLSNIVLVTIAVITVIGYFSPRQYGVHTVSIHLIVVSLFALYSLVKNKISLWSLIILSSILLVIGNFAELNRWENTNNILYANFILQLLIIPAIFIDYKKKKIELDVYLIGGFTLIILQNLNLLSSIDSEKLELLNYGVFGMFMTIIINKQTFGKMIDAIVILFLAQSSIFVINQILSTLF